MEKKIKPSVQHVNYQRVAKAVEYLSEHQSSQPGLAELSAHIGVSEFHLQRIFSEWAGISPKQFLQHLTKEYAKRKLRKTNVMDSALSCGLSGSGRLHDLMINLESVTPGEYRNFGKGLVIHYGIHSSMFGYCLIAITHRGICKIDFFDSLPEGKVLVDELQSAWRSANIVEDKMATLGIFNQIFSDGATRRGQLNVLLKGSEFQIQVWEALLRIPEGGITSYQRVAESIGRKSAVRAVSSAIAGNNIAYLIPCHRVIRSTGQLSHYRWGDERKKAMLVREARE